MNKFLLLALAVLMPMWFIGCSDDENIDPGKEDETESVEISSIVGTWENDSFFVSFGDDGFYSAYIEDEFIDSGYYGIEGRKVSSFNPYFNRETVYTIKEMSDDKFNVDISYIDLYGVKKSKTMIFSKTNTSPVSENHTLEGKSITWLSPNSGNITMAFFSYNSGVKYATRGDASKYPLNFFYVYVGDKMYHQIIKNNSVQVPTIGDWTTEYNKVKCWKLSFSSDGMIDSFENIDL